MSAANEDDPWANAREALSSAGSQASAAVVALGSAAAALAQAAVAASSATATSAYRAVEPPLKEGLTSLSSAATEFASSVAANPDLMPVLLMFLLALFALCFCKWICYSVGLFKLSLLAAFLAVPSATDAAASALAALVALVLQNASAEAALSSARATWQGVLDNPHVVAASALAIAAKNASLTFASSAYDIAAAHPHVETALAHPHVRLVLSHPHVNATLHHSHLPSLTGWLSVCCTTAVCIALLRCCLCGSRREGVSAQETPAQSAARAAKKERQKEARQQSSKASGKKGGGGGKSSLRGVGEGELRDTSEDVVSTFELVTGPFKKVYRAVKVVGGWVWKMVVGSKEEEAAPKRGGKPVLPPGGAGAVQLDDDVPATAATSASSSGRSDRPPHGSSTTIPKGKGKSNEPLLTHPRLLATLKGFERGESVTSACLSQDGNLAVAVSTDRTLRIFPGLRTAGSGTPLPAPLIANVRLDYGTACSLSANGRNVVVATAQSRKVLAYSITPKVTRGALHMFHTASARHCHTSHQLHPSRSPPTPTPRPRSWLSSASSLPATQPTRVPCAPRSSHQTASISSPSVARVT